jgi:hypothetical protein
LLFKLQLGDHGHISGLAQPRCVVDHLGGECDVAAPHVAYDHLGDALAIMQKFPNLLLMCGADVRGYLIKQDIEEERLVASPWGMMVEIAGVHIRPVYCRHRSYISDEDGIAYSSTPLAFILYADDVCGIYPPLRSRFSNACILTIFSDQRGFRKNCQPSYVGCLQWC